MTRRAIASGMLLAAMLVFGCRASSVWDETDRDISTATAAFDSPFSVAPDRLVVPVGAVARFDVLRTQAVLNIPFEWSINGLPPGAGAEFSTAVGYPVDGVVLIRTTGSALPGVYPLDVVLSTAERAWSQTITLELTPCEEMIQTGRFVTKTRVARLAGGPSTLTYGYGSSVLVFCESATPRRLIVDIESVSNEQDATSMDTVDSLILYRLLDWPPGEISEIVTQNRDDRNVESVAASEDGRLIWGITTGAYFIYFAQHQFQGTQSEVSVTYRLAVEQVP